LKSLHEEIHFEGEICDVLAANGWHYSFDDTGYDRARALYPPDLIAWVQETQPQAWDPLVKSHGAAAEATLLNRVRATLDGPGTLEALRNGVEFIGHKKPVSLVQFKPAMAMNPDIVSRFKANRLRIMRQVHYSVSNQNCLDLVLFVNGIAVATVEVKSDFTQSVEDAVAQYRFDRNPRPKGGKVEPLLSFPCGALVHFAVSNTDVMMTTKLEGPNTRFLPFNKGHDDGAGNPPTPFGHPTYYLWEEIWQRDSWLEILGRYIVAERDEKKKLTRFLFPRYHQLDATRKLVAAVRSEGAGGKYLIQHSAGSGKTNSIAWAAHFLSELHDDANEKVFSTVIVVSDRRVIDGQLQEALFSFQRTTGVVETIKNDSGAKSGQLASALAAGKKIIVCTIQTFPFALQAVQEQSSTTGKRFAVIADEAHSSQTGEAASKLKQVLSSEEGEALDDGGEFDVEDLLAAQMAAKAADSGVTYVAFTATPKSKTLQLFGRPADPSQPLGPMNLPQAFHVYSMRQAIEEDFILDVLQNYTPYALAFQLAQDGNEIDEKEVERSAAMKGIMQWVKLHPYNISQKVLVVVEHFRKNVAPLLEGKAKAMIVLASRKEAVRWKLAIDAYIKDQGYKLGTLVAFSGEVNDPEQGQEPFSETSLTVNPNLKGRDIRDAFKTDEFHLLLVANKFQTGFDQPLLCGMYVDRKLAGIQAVQTLSRLNRAYPGKDTTYVLDFSNSADAVLEAFKTYYKTAKLEGVTDPYLILNLRAELDQTGHYDDDDVDRVADVIMNPKSVQSDLVAALYPVANRLLNLYKAAREAFEVAGAKQNDAAAKSAKDEMGALALFKANLGTFVRLYAFLSQVINYGNTDIEKRAIFYKHLERLLKFGRERDELDLSNLVLTHHSLNKKPDPKLLLDEGDLPLIPPLSDAGSGTVQDKQKAMLAEIIAKVNDLFDGELTPGDKLIYVNNVIKGKFLESEELISEAMNNSKAQFKDSPSLNEKLNSVIIETFDAYQTMGKQALASEDLRKEILATLLGPGQLYEALRERGKLEQAPL
jgi:type I restriction enzyme, R subunit